MNFFYGFVVDHEKTTTLAGKVHTWYPSLTQHIHTFEFATQLNKGRKLKVNFHNDEKYNMHSDNQQQLQEYFQSFFFFTIGTIKYQHIKYIN